MFFDTAPESLVGLTQNAQKIGYYKNDFLFEHAFHLATECLGDQLTDLFNTHAMLMVKPEALVYGKSPQIFDLLSSHGFEPVYCKLCTLRTAQSSEMWKYAWSGATYMRIIANTKLFYQISINCTGRENEKQTKKKTAAETLRRLKGSAHEANRSDEQFRSILMPITPLLNHIHSADEPIDVLRELGILFDWDELVKIFLSMQSEQSRSYSPIAALAVPYEIAHMPSDPYVLLERLIDYWKSLFSDESELIRRDQIQRCIDKLTCIYKGREKFEASLLMQMLQTGKLQWSWELFVVITYFIDIFNGKPQLL